MRKSGKAWRAAAFVILACFGVTAAAAQEEQVDELQKKVDRLNARIDALGLPKFEGTQTVNTGAVVIEAAMLTSTAINGAAEEIAKEVNAVHGVAMRNVVVLAGSETVDFGLVGMFETEMNAIERRLRYALGSGRMRTTAGAAGLIGIAAGLIKSDTEFTAVEAAVDPKVLAAAVASKLRAKSAILPSSAVGKRVQGPLIEQFGKLADLAELAQRRRDELTAQDKLSKKESVQLAHLNAALTRYDSFYAKATTAGANGVVPLAAAARFEQIAGDNPLVLRVNAEKAGGTLVKRTNLLTFLGFDPHSISGGLVASYQLTLPETGSLEKAGVITCRTTLASLRQVQNGSWRPMAGAPLRSPTPPPTTADGGPAAICTSAAPGS